LDLESSPRLASTLAGLEDSAVIVDLSGLTFIDSSGLHVLASAANASRAAGGALICAAPSAQVRRVIDIVQLGETVAIEDSVDVALAHIERVRQTPE
jgi:anti-sigma B factor antagonist